MNAIIVAPGSTKPSLCKPVIDPELKYISKFISIKIANSINGINFESKSLIIRETISLLSDCCQLKTILGLSLQTNVYLNFSN